MSLRYAMLGFIDMMPLTGYDLKKLFNSSVKYYWTATHSQIYRTLDEMKKSRLIREEYIPQADLPDKKLYHITEKGKLALHQWAAQPADIPPVRHALLVQLSWADRLNTDEIAGLLREYAEKLKDRLALYADESQHRFIAMARTPREQYLWEAVLQNGIHAYRAELQWTEETIRGLEAFE